MFAGSNPDIQGDALVRRAEDIETQEDFCVFMGLLATNYRKRRKEWENDRLDRFLDGMVGFSQGFEGYVRNTGRDPSTNPWRLLATVLLAAKVYE